ncbi:hypothetical protein [Candidimonas nitroreducens]|uniref:Uncharacterized protein n=1 Tax=Candidimonas nitroreducens TaxID=683354 RepID=A0A225MP76_9BURK|nr:hypothetical protein [Candidimonas nitroreducens]OWT61790.1 hypothetical protein CEY11_08085 [Candidimonas nitroreducens]
MAHTPDDAPPRFTAEELELLGRTADALSAYMGKPVLAEVMDPEETGSEWVLFAVPLSTDEQAEDITTVQVGGASARLLGNKGGMQFGAGDVYDCEYLWAIQLSTQEGVRFIKVDRNGDDVAWTDDLHEILPFDLIDEALSDSEDDEDEDEDGDDPDDGYIADPHTPRNS